MHFIVFHHADSAVHIPGIDGIGLDTTSVGRKAGTKISRLDLDYTSAKGFDLDTQGFGQPFDGEFAGTIHAMKGYADQPALETGPWGGAGYCARSAGWGTNHKGVGRCRLHAGRDPDARGATGLPLQVGRRRAHRRAGL